MHNSRLFLIAIAVLLKDAFSCENGTFSRKKERLYLRNVDIQQKQWTYYKYNLLSRIAK